MPQILDPDEHRLPLIKGGIIRIPAFKEFPTIRVVQPAYHARPKEGQPSFFLSDSLRLSWVLVLATGENERQSLRFGSATDGMVRCSLHSAG